MVINVLSYATKARYTKSSVYSASKAGAEAMMNSLREEVRDQGIKIVNVFPGATLTPMWHQKHQEWYGDQMMHPEDVAEAIYEVTLKPKSVMIEDLVIRPQIGDLRV
jgi:short-subunit dehydrogenase